VTPVNGTTVGLVALRGMARGVTAIWTRPNAPATLLITKSMTCPPGRIGTLYAMARG
jgi:hypothetical protein